MPGLHNSPNECFGCDSTDIRYQSLLPQRVVNIEKTIPDGRNIIVDLPRKNSDFNVCEPCYLAQYAEVYPGDPLPELKDFSHHG